MELSRFIFFDLPVQYLLILSAFFLLLFLFISVRKPFVGFLIIVFLLPFEKLGSYSLNPVLGHPMIRLVQLASGAFIVAFALRMLAKKELIRKIVSMRALLIFTLSALLSAVLIDYFRVWQIFLWVLFIVALFYFAAQLSSRQNLGRIQKFLFLSAILVSIFGLYQFLGDLVGIPTQFTGLTRFYTKEVFGFPRIQSTSIEPLYYANYLLLPIFVGLSLLVARKSVPKAYWGVAALFALNFILTMSRGAFIAFLASFALFAFLFKAELGQWLELNLKRLSLLTALILVSAAGLLLLSSMISYGNPFTGPRTYAEQITTKLFKTGSFTERVDQQEKAIEVIKENPLFGVGIGGFAPWVYDYPPERLPLDWEIVNNHTLQVIAEVGLVGFMIYVVFLGTLLVRGYRLFISTKDETLKAWIGGLICAVVAIFIQYQSFSGFFITHIWITLAMLAGLSSTSKANEFRFSKIREYL